MIPSFRTVLETEVRSFSSGLQQFGLRTILRVTNANGRAWRRQRDFPRMHATRLGPGGSTRTSGLGTSVQQGRRERLRPQAAAAGSPPTMGTSAASWRHHLAAIQLVGNGTPASLHRLRGYASPPQRGHEHVGPRWLRPWRWPLCCPCLHASPPPCPSHRRGYAAQTSECENPPASSDVPPGTACCSPLLHSRASATH